MEKDVEKDNTLSTGSNGCALHIPESIYDMGNTDEIASGIYDDISLAEEIIENMGLIDRESTPLDPVEFANRFSRKGGIIDRLKTHLNFDLEMYGKENITNQRERGKIIYLFYFLENICFRGTNVLLLFGKPSMENIDNLDFGWKTNNGEIIQKMKKSSEMEITPIAKNEIISTFCEIGMQWDSLINCVRLTMDYYLGVEFDFKDTIDFIQRKLRATRILHKVDSPIKTLYLKILQHEQRGNIKDISRNNNISIETSYSVPPELIEEMQKLSLQNIAVNDIKNYIHRNAGIIEKFVYRENSRNKERRRVIRNNAIKVQRLFDFFERGRFNINPEEYCTELQIVSCLQAIILDPSNEIFDYTPYAYQKHKSRKAHVHGALKNDDYTYDALKTLWTRKVVEHWYANMGRFDRLQRLREFENSCDEALLKIFSVPSVDGMIEMHNQILNALHGALSELYTTMGVGL